MCRLLHLSITILSFQLICGLWHDSSEEKMKVSKLSENDEIVSDNHGFYFMLYTRKNPITGYKLNPVTVSSLSQTSFDANKITKICIHGYHGSSQKFVVETGIKDSYLNVFDVNVFVMDWSACAGNFLYTDVIQCMPTAGDELSNLLETLQRMKISPDLIHMVGFSLGAHVAGQGASKMPNYLISRITALDAAKPLLEDSLFATQRILLKTDAKFVDAIHTDAGLFGTIRTFSVDFYPNGGHASQRGCNKFVDAYMGYCSHRRSYAYFNESIDSPAGFFGVKCDHHDDFKSGKCDGNDVQLMGEFVDKRISGKYYLDTNGEPPYARGKNIHVDD